MPSIIVKIECDEDYISLTEDTVEDILWNTYQKIDWTVTELKLTKDGESYVEDSPSGQRRTYYVEVE